MLKDYEDEELAVMLKAAPDHVGGFGVGTSRLMQVRFYQLVLRLDLESNTVMVRKRPWPQCNQQSKR